MPGLPGAHEDSSTSRIGGEAGDEGVLARAAAEDENSHCLQGFRRWTSSNRRAPARRRDYFVDLDGDCA